MKRVYYNGKPVKDGKSEKLIGEFILTQDFLNANKRQFKISDISYDAKYVRCKKWTGATCVVGDIYKVENLDIIVGTNKLDINIYYENFEDAYEHEWKSQELLKEAKKRYPAGVVFAATSGLGVSRIKYDTRFYWNEAKDTITTSVHPGDVYDRTANKWAVIKESVPVHPVYIKIKTEISPDSENKVYFRPYTVHKVLAFKHGLVTDDICAYISPNVCVPIPLIESATEDDFKLEILISTLKSNYKVGDKVRPIVPGNPDEYIKSLAFAYEPSLKELWVIGHNFNILIYKHTQGWARKIENSERTLIF